MKILNSLDTEADFSDIEPHIEHAHWNAILCAVQSGSFESDAQLSFDLWKPFSTADLKAKLMDLVDHLRSSFQLVAKELKCDLAQIAELFKTKPMFALLKTLKFSIKLALLPLREFAALYKQGILKIFAELEKSGALKSLKNNAQALDKWMDEHPLIKRLSGPAIAGLLIWMFLSGNFTWHPDLDMDLAAAVKAALFGHWSAAELFTTPEGLMALSLLITGLSVPWPTPVWLDAQIPINILLAMMYTSIKHLKPTVDTKKLKTLIQPRIRFATITA